MVNCEIWMCKFSKIVLLLYDCFLYSTIENRILKYPSTHWIVYFPLQFSQFLFCVFWGSIVMFICVYNFYLFLMDWDLLLWNVPVYLYFFYFCFKVYLSDIDKTTTIFLWLLFSNLLLLTYLDVWLQSVSPLNCI